MTENVSAIDEIEYAVGLLVEAARPRRIVLFGSRARGDAEEGSDLDLLVVEDTVSNRHAEIVRLLRVLEPHGIAADVFVVSECFFLDWRDVPGQIVFEAAHEGRVVYDAG